MCFGFELSIIFSIMKFILFSLPSSLFPSVPQAWPPTATTSRGPWAHKWPASRPPVALQLNWQRRSSSLSARSGGSRIRRRRYASLPLCPLPPSLPPYFPHMNKKCDFLRATPKLDFLLLYFLSPSLPPSLPPHSASSAASWVWAAWRDSQG